jgi:hypothetical protein
MAIDFPNSPTNGQTVTFGTSVYTWNSAKSTWDLTTATVVGPTGPTGSLPAGSSVTIGKTSDYFRETGTNNITTGGDVISSTVTDNYASRDVIGGDDPSTHTINIGVGNVDSPDNSASKIINIGTGSLIDTLSSSNINIGGAGTVVALPSTTTINGRNARGVIGGTGTTTSGSNLTVTHGLGGTPAAVVVSVRRNAYSSTDNTNVYVGNIGETTFTVAANNGAGGAVAAPFNWIAVA